VKEARKKGLQKARMKKTHGKHAGGGEEEKRAT